jgi:CRISPR-associated exonuclease Cas4
VPPLVPTPPSSGGEREIIPLSAINHFLFCHRRAALIHIEGIFIDNQHTVRGDIVHEHADLPGYEVAKGVKLLRALPVWSERLGLSGKCDIVEVEGDQGAEVGGQKSDLNKHLTPALSPERRGGTNLTPALSALDALTPNPSPIGWARDKTPGALRPVEYKKGKRRQFDNDDAQLCAQALCLEEMFGIVVQKGAVFHAASKRRREVEFTPELRKLTEDAVMELHRLVASETVPSAVLKPACEECSLYNICLPQVTSHPARLANAAAELFKIR